MENFDEDVIGFIKCPVCGKSKNMVYRGTKGMSSSRCSICLNYIKYDYDNMTAVTGKALKGATKKLAG